MRTPRRKSPAETRAHISWGVGGVGDSPEVFGLYCSTVGNGTLFGLNDLEALLTVIGQAI